MHFEVATIKPTSRNDGAWRLQPTADGFTGMDVSLRMLVEEAYNVFDGKLVTGGPAWIDKDKFDLEAKFNAAEVEGWQHLSFQERTAMLQPLLAERFKLQVHFETRTFPVFALVVAKSGPKLSNATDEESRDRGGGTHCLHSREGRMEGCSMADLAGDLRYSAGRPVIDRTGLPGRYTFQLHWDRDANSTAEQRADSPTLFTALQEQLGLKLEPTTASMQVLVIDSAEKPSEN